MKDQSRRLAEVMAIYEELNKFGVTREAAAFRDDCQAFVRDGTPASGRCMLESMDRYLHYELKTKDGTESFAVIKNNRA